MIKLFGHPGSTCTRKVLTALAETGIRYEMNVVELSKGEHKQEPHLSRQPFGQVPAIEDDGFKLHESRAICRYLSAKADDLLVPRDVRRRAVMDQWSSIEQSNFSPNAMKHIFHHVMQRPQEAAVLEAATKMLELTYATLARQLEDKQFIVGDQFTIADIGFMPYIEYMSATPAKATLDKYPAVVGWWQRVSKRPSWLKVTGRA